MAAGGGGRVLVAVPISSEWKAVIFQPPPAGWDSMEMDDGGGYSGGRMVFNGYRRRQLGRWFSIVWHCKNSVRNKRRGK